MVTPITIPCMYRVGLLLLLSVAPAGAQIPPAVERERADYAEWLRSAPNSPQAAVAQQVVGDGVQLGPSNAEIPLEGIAAHAVREQHGALRLEGPDGARPMPRHRPVPLGDYTLVASGVRGRTVLTVFRASPDTKVPEFFRYDPALVFEGPLAPPAERRRVRVLSVDGVEVEATEAGTVAVPIGGATTRLRVLRIPYPGTDESELEIFFRDATNGRTTYPAGRFVSLEPLPSGRYRLDFNRARNPFCAYNSVYPCPAPWRGNTIAAPVEAGERYAGGGLTVPVTRETD